MTFAKANELPFDARPQLSRIFAESFYTHGLQYFSKDIDRLARALAHAFDLTAFYAAVEGEELMGIVGVTAKKPPPIKLDKKILIRELGFFRGRLANWGLNKFMVNHQYPFPMHEKMGSIEFVATSAQHRGKGVASALVAHVMEQSGFDEYVLEVVDTNAGAIRVYERLGFAEFIRTPAPRGSGFNFFVYMKKS